MAESQGPRPPRPTIPAGAPLPRRKPENTVLLEETPKLDTYQTRQKIRIVMGIVSVGLFFPIGFILFRVFTLEPIEEPAPPSSEGIATGG